MKFEIPVLLLMALASWAQEKVHERVPLRVSSLSPLVIDRGERDGVEVGDRVVLSPRRGGSYGGTVLQVDDRSAVLELDDKSFVPEIGTKGEVLIPRSRFEDAEEPEPPEPPEEKKTTDEEKEEPDDPEWKNKDGSWSPDKPLLAGRPLRPRDRAPRLSGRIYGLTEIVHDIDGYSNSFFRLGTDLVYSNLFRRGGELRLNGELGYLETVDDDTQELNPLLRRLSYTWGGDRFARDRFEGGRFLQVGVPEFGVLDGVEWIRRRDNGHRFGFAAGWLPEPDEDFGSFTDAGISGFYEWISDPHEQLVLTGGYQKTFHHGTADRDLLIGKVRFLPAQGWQYDGTVFIDVYTGKDDGKGSGLDLTQAVVTARRHWSRSSVDVTFTHIRFPDILRNGEFLQGFADLSDRRLDRLAGNGTVRLSDRTELTGHLSVWNDEDETGGAAEFGAVFSEVWLPRSTASITGTVNFAEFENRFGGRVTYGQAFTNGRWDVLYELANHHLLGFPSDRDDLVQHRVRLSGNYYLDTGWDFSAHVESIYWDEELTWAIGFNWQKRF